MHTPGLIEHQTITTIIDNVNQARHDIDLAFKLLQGAKDRLNAVLGDGSAVSYGHLWERDISDYNLPQTLEKIQAYQAKNAWRYLLRQTGLMAYLTERRQKELQAQLDKGELPVLTVANVLSTLEGLHGQLGTLLLESVKEVFDWLRPQRTHYKTNQKFQVGRKVIITNAIGSHWAGEWHLNYYREADFRSLGNVMSLLDGQGVQQYPHDLVTQLRVVLKEGAGTGAWLDVPYMRVKPYGNGNLHVQFTRHDLVDRLNQLGSDGTLPAATPVSSRPPAAASAAPLPVHAPAVSQAVGLDQFLGLAQDIVGR